MFSFKRSITAVSTIMLTLSTAMTIAGVPVPLEKVVQSTDLWSIPALIEVRLYESESSTDVIAEQIYHQGEWQSDADLSVTLPKSGTIRFSMTLDQVEALEAGQILWAETIMDGQVMGERSALAAIQPPKFTIEGEIETKGATGGIRFPDGSFQDSASSSDNLGDHTATANIQLNGNWLSNDGGNKGIHIDDAGKVGIGTNSHPSSQTWLTVKSATTDSHGGMYVSTSGLSARPFYGYSTTGTDISVWHEYNGSENEWQLVVGGKAISVDGTDQKITLFGNLDMNNNAIFNIPAPSNPGDAISFSYLQSYVAPIWVVGNGCTLEGAIGSTCVTKATCPAGTTVVSGGCSGFTSVAIGRSSRLGTDAWTCYYSRIKTIASSNILRAEVSCR
jgi:hypothetical protein